VEDTTSLWPFSLETTGLKVLVSSLEEEVISDELLSVRIGHAAKRVVSSLEFSIERRESSDYFLLNLFSLLGSHGGTERIVSQVTGNSDSGGVDHCIFISWEVWAVELSVIHIADVLVSL